MSHPLPVVPQTVSPPARTPPQANLPELFPIPVIPDDGATVNPARRDVIPPTRQINPQRSCHTPEPAKARPRNQAHY